MRRSTDQESDSYYCVQVNQHGLHIQVISPTQTFTGLIKSVEMIDSLESFKDLENLKKYIEDRENIEIYLEKPCLEILKKVRSRLIIIAQIPLKKKICLTKKPFKGPNSIFTVMQELTTSNTEFKEHIKSQEKFNSQALQTEIFMRIMMKKQVQMNKLLERMKYQISCIEGYKKAEEWANPQSYCYQNFKFVGNRIISNSNRSISIFGNINLREKSSFTVQIKKMKSKMRIGLADQSFIQKEYLKDVKNKFYILNNKQQEDDIGNQPNYLREGMGFKVGDRVSVKIDLKELDIRWIVGSQSVSIIANECMSQKEKILKDQSITWVPFISLFSQQDEVAII